jgi:hypothetical protein
MILINKNIFGRSYLYSAILSAFKSRVSTDSGIFEAETCLDAQLNNLNNKNLLSNASLILTPNAYKVNKIYSVVPSTGNGDLTFVRNTTATRVNKDGIIESVATNVVRIDYTNESCPSILVEPQRTNLLTNSEGNISTYPVKSNVADSAISINGFSKSIFFDDNSVLRFAYKNNFTPVNGTTYNLSVFIEMADGGLPVIGLNGSTGDFSIIMNGNFSINDVKVNLINNNIYRISASNTATSTTKNFGIVKYSTQSARKFKISGIQLEQGSNATSYIPTVASAVTRNAEVISKTGISDLIGQTEGTIFAEFNFTNLQNINRYLCDISDGTNTNRLELVIDGNNALRFLRQSSTQSATTQLIGSTLSFGLHKVAVSYKSGSTLFFIDGVKVGSTNANTFIFSILNIINLGSREQNSEQLGDSIRHFQLYKTALTDAECITLTTL